MFHVLCSTLQRGGIPECPRPSGSLGPKKFEGEAAAVGERSQSEDHFHIPLLSWPATCEKLERWLVRLGTTLINQVDVGLKGGEGGAGGSMELRASWV